MSRLFESKGIRITQGFHSKHTGVDMTADGGFDYVTAHSDGVVTRVINNCDINTSGNPNYGGKPSNLNTSNPGNMVVIEHSNGYTSRYLHLAYGKVYVKKGDNVKKGQRIGYMGSTGYSFGAHLHFDLTDTNGNKIDPTPYLNSDLPNNNNKNEYEIGDYVTINGVYQSSVSDKKLRPRITKGQITRIISNARNPYLLDNGNIGWVNKDCIVGKENSGTTYTIKEGDTLSSIASKYNTTWQRIYEKNHAVLGNNPNLIYPGTKIVI